MRRSSAPCARSLAAWLLAASVALAGCSGGTVQKPPSDAQAPRAAEPAPPQPIPVEPAPAARPEGPQPAPEGPSVILAPSADVIRVALLLPLSGSDEPVGRALLRAAQMALFDLADDRFELLPLDTKASPAGAAEAAATAIERGARLVLGPLFATSVPAVAPLTRAAGISLVAFSNNREVAGPDVYIIGRLPGEQVARVVRYARGRGVLRFAALVPESAYGRVVLEAMRGAVEAAGADLTRAESYAPGDDAALTRAIRSMTGSAARGEAASAGPEQAPDFGFDALLIPESGTRLTEIVARLQYYDLDVTRVRLLGVASWLRPDLGREPGLIGGWFAAPDQTAWRSFESRFAEIYGARPPEIAALGYDATALAAVLARSGEGLGAAEIETPRGFAGAGGLFRFTGDGTAERGLAVFEVRPNGARVVSPAPSGFGQLVN